MGRIVLRENRATFATRASSAASFRKGAGATHVIVDVTAATPPTWSSGVFEYDGAGNIKKIGTTSSPNGDGRTNTFVYDTAGRLVSAGANYATTNSETYEYYSFGNLKKISTTISGSTIVNTIAVDDSTNRLSTATYDDAGNVRWDGVLTTYSWDALGGVISKQTSGASEEYIYTAGGERIAVRNTVLDHWMRTLRDFDGKMLREYRSSPGGGNAGSRGPMTWVEDYVYRDGVLAAAVRPASQEGTRHFHLDHLSTPRLVTDSSRYAFGYHDYFARQSATLSELANKPVLDVAFLKRLRDESADGGRSNIGRSARDLSS